MEIFLLVIYGHLPREHTRESDDGCGMGADEDALDVVSGAIGQDALHGVGHTIMELGDRFTTRRGQDGGGEAEGEVFEEGLKEGGRGRTGMIESCSPIPFPGVNVSANACFFSSFSSTMRVNQLHTLIQDREWLLLLRPPDPALSRMAPASGCSGRRGCCRRDRSEAQSPAAQPPIPLLARRHSSRALGRCRCRWGRGRGRRLHRCEGA